MSRTTRAAVALSVVALVLAVFRFGPTQGGFVEVAKVLLLLAICAFSVLLVLELLHGRRRGA